MMEHDLDLSSGRVHAHERGADAAGLVLCAPGLSSNACGFVPIAGRLAGEGRRVVALDLRGRGRSETTAPGTYGWAAHARDLAEAASILGAERFDLVGHSMGAYVAMQAAADHPERVGRLVLIDGAGAPETAALGPIAAGLRRLDRWHPPRTSTSPVSARGESSSPGATVGALLPLRARARAGRAGSLAYVAGGRAGGRRVRQAAPSGRAVAEASRPGAADPRLGHAG